ncbi:MAG: hypothetical protein ACREAA_20540 [Candidatus Polarisedimenticolia bacterium]
MLAEEAHKGTPSVAFGELAGQVHLGHRVNHASGDSEAFHQRVELRPFPTRRQEDNAVLLVVVGVALEDDHVKQLASVHTHGESPVRGTLQHGTIGAQ